MRESHHPSPSRASRSNIGFMQLPSGAARLCATGPRKIDGSRKGRPPGARVYTQSHADYVIETIVSVHQRRQALRGYKISGSPGHSTISP
jgi:hypothetical protein